LGFVPTTSFNDARSRAVVAPGLLDGKLIPRITVGVKGQAIAEFTIADSADMADHYAAAIRWGSGQEEQGTIEPTGPGTFTVRTSRVFLESKYEQLTISIYDLNRSKHFGTVGIVKGSIFVQTHLSLLVNTLTATAGQEFNGVVATLRSIGTGTLWSSQFSALIDWGDGQSSPGQVVANDSGGWDVVGFHTYEITGYHERRSVNVRVEETRTPLDPSLPAPEHAYVVAARSGNSWQILPGDIEGFRLHALGWTDSATAGQSRYLFLATLTAQEPDAQFGDFTGQVNWDDGGVSPAFVNYNYGYDFTIHSSYLFATAGKHTGTLTITGAGFTHSIEVEVEVREPVPPPPPPPPPLPPLARIHPQSIAAVVGVEFSGILATFIPRDADAKPADFTVSIYWGDGGSSDGVITLDSQGRFVISGSHIYHREYTGDYHWFDMTLRRGSESRWERGNFTVVRNPNFVYAEGRDDLHFRQREELTTKVASFTPIAGKGLEDYEALIDWGDGRVTPGTISEGYDGWLDVSGATTYQRDGTLTIKVTIKGPGGPVEAQSSIRLDHDPVVVNPVQPAVNELEVRGTLASFTDADGGSTAEYQVTYAALIDWGDGLITSGTVAAAADGSQQVSGSHIYVAPGDYRVRLIVRRNMRQLPQLSPPPGYYPSYSFRQEWIYYGDIAWGNTLYNASYNSAESIDEAEYGHFLYTLHLARSASGGDVGGQSQDSRGKKKARRARISGTVFRDANANGRRDKKEARLAGWRVFLDLDRDGVFDKAEPSTVTDERGRYVFGKAPSGKQMVRVVPRRGTLAKGKGGARALRVIEGRILNGQHVGIQGAKVVDR
jgi:PKD repeat protein